MCCLGLCVDIESDWTVDEWQYYALYVAGYSILLPQHFFILFFQTAQFAISAHAKPTGDAGKTATVNKHS